MESRLFLPGLLTGHERFREGGLPPACACLCVARRQAEALAGRRPPWL
jgi:hypothetical protein